MKKFIISIFILTLATCGGIVLGKTLSESRRADASVTAQNKPAVTSESFAWGAFSNPYAFNGPDGKYNSENIDAQVAYWQDLGLNSLKFNYEFNVDEPFVVQKENDYLADKLAANNIDGYMVIEYFLKDKDFFAKADFDRGYAWGKFIAERFKGRVKYYQMLNEVSGTAIKKDFPGNQESDYDEAKYQAVKNFLLGMSKGIKEADPEAQRVITAHWVGTAMIDRLIKDGVDFEIIGWDWFSDMGNDITAAKPNDKTVINIPEHFKNTGKRFWISEINHQGGSYKNKESDQAAYLKKAIENALKSKLVSGIFVFNLFDATSVTNGKANQYNQWGLVENAFDKATQKWTAGKKKTAYKVYKDIISRFSGGI